jgi:hypothetical protein
LPDINWFQDVQCSSGACNLTTSLDVMHPTSGGAIKELKRHNVEIISFRVDDSFEFRPFLRMGVFAP